MLATESPVTDRTRLIRAEYQEMPGLLLTSAQVCRMWGLDCATCRAAMDELLRCGFLVARQNGAYGRPAECFEEGLS
jgi:hypothetical protein